MINMMITLEKYYELAGLINDGLGTELGKFQRVYKCNPMLLAGAEPGTLRLDFDEEKDMVWFKLKYL